MDRHDSPSFDTDMKFEYTPPTIKSMREEEVLEQVGPAQAYTGNLPFGF